MYEFVYGACSCIKTKLFMTGSVFSWSLRRLVYGILCIESCNNFSIFLEYK